MLTTHYPSESLLSSQVITELHALMEDARAHPEHLEAKRHGMREGSRDEQAEVGRA